jgi:DNA-binding winged helix-turn-helix (wHTH) protein
VSKRFDSPTVPTPGLLAFDNLRAEDEPWLERCYVPPAEFDLIAGSRSVVVFGEPGSGKTALYQALKRRLIPDGVRPTHLSFEWRPLASVPPEVEVERLLAACAQELLSYLATWPATFSQSSHHNQTTLTWFVQKYLSGSLPRMADELEEKVDEKGQALLRNLVSSTVSDEYLSEAYPEQIIVELTKALSKIGLTGVCVLVGPDELGDVEGVGDGLSSFLSTLRLFENPRFAYKLVLPAQLEPVLARAGGVVRRRLDRYRLDWLEHHLTTIVERRLSLASEGEIEKLQDVCQDKELPVWLARCGGTSPRGWLDQVRPLAAHYLDLRRPVTTDEWRQIRLMRPPEFWLDEAQRCVVVGYRRIRDLPDIEWAILRYLYQHRDRICSREELYHEAHLPGSGAPQTDRRFFPKEYEGALNNALMRLRQAVEPTPRSPLFIVTHKGKGVRLEHVW